MQLLYSIPRSIPFLLEISSIIHMFIYMHILCNSCNIFLKKSFEMIMHGHEVTKNVMVEISDYSKVLHCQTELVTGVWTKFFQGCGRHFAIYRFFSDSLNSIIFVTFN